MIAVKIITDTPAFLSLGEGWNRLLAASPSNSVFLTWEWISTWWEIFKEGKSLRVLAFFDGDTLVGVAPFYLKERRIAGMFTIRELRFLGCGESVRSEYMDIVSPAEHRKECVERTAHSLANSRDWDIAVLNDLSPDSLLAPALPQHFSRVEILDQGPCYHVVVPDTFNAYLQSIDRNKRGNIRTCRRNLERDFTVSYRRLGPEDNLEGWMTDFKRLHAERLRERGLPSKFSDPRYSDLHTKVSRLFQERGWLFAASLRLNDETVAARYDYIYNNKVYDYQTGFDPRFGKQGVMQALISYMIEDCVNNKIGEFDFLAGDEDYKRRFANAKRTVCSFRITNRTLRGRICGLGQRLTTSRKA